jgi:predicted nucleic acid-binding protein
MMTVIDTCIVVDVLQSREPFYKDAQEIFLRCADRKFDGFLTAKSVTDIYYLTHRLTHNERATREILARLGILFGLLDTAALDIRKAIWNEMSDFEDAVMVETAVRSGAECIVTRNIKDYDNVPIPVYSPSEFLEILDELEDEKDL